MLRLAFIASLLLTSAAAAVVKVCPVKPNGCSLGDLKMPELPATLAAPTQPLAYVSVAIGTQNYTCSEEGKYAYVDTFSQNPAPILTCFVAPQGRLQSSLTFPA